MVYRLVPLSVAVVCLTLGCAQPGEGGGLFNGNSPMRPIALPQQGIALDIVFVRRPLGDPEINGQLREEVDEQVLDSALRDALTRNGFWVATAGEPLPRTLESLLHLDQEKSEEDAEAPSSDSHAPPDETGDVKVPRETSQSLMLRSGKNIDVFTRNEKHDECFVLVWENGSLVGDEFQEAQCVLIVTPHLENDGRVRVEFLPQIRYGKAKVGHEATLEGGWQFAAKRPQRTFSHLAWEVTVSPRELVLVSCTPKPEGSLGYQFFSTPAGEQLEQNLVLVRVSDVARPKEDLLAGP